MARQRAGRIKRRSVGVKVLKLADGRHVARWRDPLSGKERQQGLDALGLTNDTTRRRWATEKAEQLAVLKRAVSLGTVEASRATPKEAAAEFLATIRHEPTRRSKRVVLDSFAAWCARAGLRDLAELAGPRLMRWRDEVLGSGRAPLTCNQWLAVTRHFLRWARSRGLAPLLSGDAIREAAEAIRVPREEPNILRPPVLRVVLEAALAHDERPGVPRRIAPVVLLLLLTGCRIAEAVGLLWQEIDFDAGEIRLGANRTKTRSSRAVPWRETPTLGKLLRALHKAAGTPARGRVFADLTGPSWASAARRMVEKHGAPEFTAHTLRRTCGSVLSCAPSIYGAAAPLLSARRLGHSVAVAERAYVGTLRELPREALTLEAAAGIEDLAERIVSGVKA